jgi:secondary thiamine-phosphate synthase enzyme
MHQETLKILTTGRSIIDITEKVNSIVNQSKSPIGLCNVFVHHTSASLFINENADPDVQGDLERFFTRLVPDGDPIYRHIDEGPDDMSAHVRSVLTATSLNIPVKNKQCDLGTWQGIYLWEHRSGSHLRKITVSILN